MNITSWSWWIYLSTSFHHNVASFLLAICKVLKIDFKIKTGRGFLSKLSTEQSISSKIKRHYSNLKLSFVLIAQRELWALALLFSFPITTSYTCTSLMTNWLNQMSISTLTTLVPITNYHANGLSDMNYKPKSMLHNGYYIIWDIRTENNEEIFSSSEKSQEL